MKLSAARIAQAQPLVIKMMGISGRWGEENQIAGFITQYLVKAGLSPGLILRDQAHKRSPFGGQCGNIIVKLPGTPGRTREPRRLLMAHMDTVPLCVGSRPVRKGSIVRSANPHSALGGDDRSGSAAILFTLTELLRSKAPHPPLTFLWCVQEEVGLCGARFVDVAKLGRPRMGFNFDGSAPAILTIGATGAYRMNIQVKGIASHAGMHPERGVSATAIASLALASLHQKGWHGLVMKQGVRGSSNAGVISGGHATNVVTDNVAIRAEARAHNRRLRKRIVVAYKSAFHLAAQSVKNEVGQTGEVTFHVTDDYESFELSRGEACVTAAHQTLQEMGLTPVYRVADGGLDANWLYAHGVPTVTLGVGQHNIHMTSEYLDLDEYTAGCELAYRLATGN